MVWDLLSWLLSLAFYYYYYYYYHGESFLALSFASPLFYSPQPQIINIRSCRLAPENCRIPHGHTAPRPERSACMHAWWCWRAPCTRKHKYKYYVHTCPSPGCSQIVTVPCFLRPMSCCINLNWPRGNTLVSVCLHACTLLFVCPCMTYGAVLVLTSGSGAPLIWSCGAADLIIIIN